MKKLRNYGLPVLFVLLVNGIFARELTGQEAQQKIPGAERVMTGTRSAVPEFIQFRKEATIEFTKFNTWAHNAFALSSAYGFKLLSSDKDAIGYTHYRYQQTFNGFPMEGTMLIVHVTNNRIASMNGVLFDRLNVARSSSLGEASALSKAIEYMHADQYRWQVPQLEEQLKQVTGNPNASWYPSGELMLVAYKGHLSSENFRLAYRFDVYASRPLKREYVFVDASTGEIIYTKNRIQTSDVVGTAVTAYSGSKEITTDSVNTTTFRLREAGRGQGIETYNLQQSTTYSNTDFIDANNYWNNVNAQMDEYATDAHWGAEMTYDFYMTKFGRNSIDNAGMKMISYVHYDVNYVNAFWDGNEMTYGDGNGAYNPLTCLDVTGHEISHGVTELTSNLDYADEPGAMNEGFSDCMGNAIRHYGKQSAVINWLIGDEMGGTPFRSMSNPGAYGNPDTYQGTNWDFANQEVHQNSTVLSHWFYLLTEGGSGTNDNGDAYSVSGIGIEKAQAICYRMNTVYLFPASQYSDARRYAIQAAIDLFGPCTNEVIQTTNAWRAVGVGNPYSPVVISDFLSPVTIFCMAPATVGFANQSNNAGAFSWNFGDGSALSSQNSPTHTYSTYGLYTVTLIADGGACGIDTLVRTQYINVDSLNPCIVSLPATGAGVTQTACTGLLYDNGGPGANYEDNTDVSITIAPVGAATVTLTFSAFNLEANYDYLYVYDGPNTGSTLIGTYSGNTLPNGGTITSTTGYITIRQTSDQALNYAGFGLTWLCSIANVAPTANFSANVTTSCSGVIQFTDQSINGPTSWNWNFGDGNSSNQQSPAHIYSTSGTYTVTMTATNSHGTDSSTQVNYININIPPAPSSNNASICSGYSATLGATGASVLNWFSVASGGSSLGTGPVFNTPVLNNSATYYVESDVFPAYQYNGPVDNTFGGGGIFTNNSYRDIIFDCYSTVKLVSVLVYAQGAGNRTITLMRNGTTLQSATVNIPNGTSRVTLNFVIPAGTNYELGTQGTVNLFRNNSGATFPYTINGLISLTGTNAGQAGFYYFFYDWELQEPPCVSPRTPVAANVSASPVASFSSNVVSATTVDFVDNSTISSGTVTGWSWNFGDSASGANNSSNLQNPTHIFSANGVYTVCLITTGSSGCSDTTCQSFLISNVGIASHEENSSIIVFPNPVSDLMTIHFDPLSHSVTWTMKLIDVLGKVVAEKTITPGSAGSYEWNVSLLAPGAYLLQLESENQKLMKTIVRQ